jgi:dTDP-4-amino-4,6-dideoxygalactose transaminase
MKIPITKPYFGEEEKKAVVGPLETGWVVQGPNVKEFESGICSYTGSSFAKATTSCTTALHLSLLACGVGAGDEVILPSFTFVASANAIESTGARPVFVDIELPSMNIHAKAAAEAVTGRTKAIMPVHLFGLCADMDPILRLARERGLAVIEDAACGIGGFYRGRHAGTMGAAGCLSFHPRKSITTGEGGMVLTDDPDLDRRIEVMRDHGAAVTDAVRHSSGAALLPSYALLGYNYRMTDMQGAIGVEQLKKLPRIIEEKRRLASRYSEELSELEWISTPVAPDGYDHGFQSYVCLFAPRPLGPKTSPDEIERMNGARNAVMAELAGAGIATRQGTHAVHTLDYYKEKYGLRAMDFPNSFAADRLSIAIPLYPGMTESEQDAVIEALRAACVE